MKKSNTRQQSWRYSNQKSAAILAYYCIITVVTSLLTAMTAVAHEGGKTFFGGVILLGCYYSKDLVENYYDGLSGIPAFILKAVAFWSLVLGISYVSCGVYTIAMM